MISSAWIQPLKYLFKCYHDHQKTWINYQVTLWSILKIRNLNFNKFLDRLFEKESKNVSNDPQSASEAIWGWTQYGDEQESES
jgi:phosphorylcholine metabolism protein LicD